MREKYESLALVQLKELAKARGLRGTSAMKKAELVEAMLAEDERLEKQEKDSTGKSEKTTVAGKSEKKDGTAKSEEKQQNDENASKTVHKRNVVTKSGAPLQERNERFQSAANEGKDRAEAVVQPENGRRTEDFTRAEVTRTESTAGSRSDAVVSKGENAGFRVDTSAARGESTGYRTDAPQAKTDAQAAPRPMRTNEVYDEKTYPKELDSGEEASGILEVMPDGYGFIRCENYLPGENDVYVAPSQIRRFGLKTGDILRGNKRIKTQQEKFSALLFIRTINGYTTEEAAKRKGFENMTPIFPNERIRLEMPGSSVAMRVMDLVSPVGKGQRGMIVSPPKAGKTTLLKEVAKSILCTSPNVHMLILLIDERPEEVTDIKEAISGANVEVIYSTFDELPEHHKRVSEMVIERAKRLVEHKKDVVILLDSITRLARAYNLVVPPSGRTLSGGLDPAALHMPKRFFGAARNMREGGSLTILATALVDTGSKMDDVIYEEFKGTGNMEMILDRKLSEKRIFPAIDLAKSGTRREDLLLTGEELEAINIMRKALNGMKADEATDRILDMFSKAKNNNDFVQMVKRNKFI
ncbi:MAG: transcription termination factor Rho [Lachnospiraceae bacterium]|nr:transcription termination factor Rho [Lachnospiraceae bacterium]